MTFNVPVRTKIGKMCGGRSGRFALQHVEISPATIEDHVFMAATDARAAIVVQQPGKIEETVLVNGKDLPLAGAKLKTAELTRTESGQVRCNVNNGTESSAVSTDSSKMPNIHDILPQIHNSGQPGEVDWVQISISPKLLLRWCEAAGAMESDSGIALFVKPPNTDGSAVVAEGICALEFRDSATGRHCIGAIMPLTPDDNSEQIAAQRYEATRRCFMAAKTGDSVNAPNLVTVDDQETIAKSAGDQLEELIRQTQEVASDAS